MINVGSISDQTLGGIVTTATHGTGINYGVISTHVMGLSLLLADGSRVFCSRQERNDLFIASICGLGSTGLILTVTLEVEPAFRLKEVQKSMQFHECVRTLDSLVTASEHVRFWWFPAADTMRVSSADRTVEVSSWAHIILISNLIPFQPAKLVGSWLWHSFFGFHVLQSLLFVARYFLSLNIFIGRFAAWLVSTEVITIDDSFRIFNLECRVGESVFRLSSITDPILQYAQHTTEWAIPYENTKACLYDLHEWIMQELSDPKGLRPHFPIEVRFSDSDDIWLSPSNGQKTCWIGIVQFKYVTMLFCLFCIV